MLGLAVSLFASCNDAKSPDSGTNPAGTFLSRPDGSGFTIVDPSFGGEASDLSLQSQRWGRLVDVFAFDTNGVRVLMHEDFLIGGDLIGSSLNWTIEVNAVTGKENLIVDREVRDEFGNLLPGGIEQFAEISRNLAASTAPVFDRGFVGSGFFSMTPRNSAVSLQFSDLLDPSTINSDTVRVLTGIPAIIPFQARVLPDMNFGDEADLDGDGVNEIYTTRVLVDFTISELESFAESPALTVNPVGLPGSLDANQANVHIRIPTTTNSLFNQELVLTNATGHRLNTSQSGSFDPGSPTSTWSAPGARVAAPRPRRIRSTASFGTRPRRAWSPTRSR